MQKLGTFHQREIFYTAQVEDLAAVQSNNWMALLLAHTYSAKAHAHILETVMAHDPLFVQCCCTNFTDMEDAVVDLLGEKYPGFDDDTIMPMTYGETSLESSLHFSVYDAFHEEKDIEQIIIFDLGEPTHELMEIKKILDSFS